MDGEHIKSKPGSKGLRSREQGAGRKEPSLGTKQSVLNLSRFSASGWWMSSGSISQRMNGGKLWTLLGSVTETLSSMPPLEWNVGRWSLGWSGCLPYAAATSCSQDTTSHSART